MSPQTISHLPSATSRPHSTGAIDPPSPSFTPSTPSTPPLPCRRGSAQPDPIVVRAFVDFWNFHLSLTRWRRRFRFDWSRLGPSLAKEVEALWRVSGRAGRVQYGGLHLYISYNPAAPHDEGLCKWARNVLGRFEGVHLLLKARRPKDAPSCPACHAKVATCPCCKASMHRTTEKGMDTAIVTDMVRLAWEDRWHAAVLVSADGDFVPAVEHLQQKGHAVVHAGFAPNRSALARTCCASVDLAGVLRSIERASSAPQKPKRTGECTSADASARASRGNATARARRVLTEKREEPKESCSRGSQNGPLRGLTG